MLEQPIRKFFDVGSIVYGVPPGALPPFINIQGARNGLEIDGSNFVVLGQTIGQGGSPAKLLSDREIPFQDFTLNLGVPGESTVSQLNIGSWILRYLDTDGNVAIQIQPPNNVTETGDVGQNLPAIKVAETYAYSNPASSGELQEFNALSVWQPSAGAVAYIAYKVSTEIAQSGTASGDVTSFESDFQTLAYTGGVFRGFYHPAPDAPGTFPEYMHRAFENTTGDVYLCTSNQSNAGRVSVRQDGGDPTAFLHLGPGKPTTGQGIMKFTAGSFLPAVEQGAWGYDGTELRFARTALADESVLTTDGSAAAPATAAAVVQTAFIGTGGTTYLSLPAAWGQVSVNGNTFVIPLYNP